MDVSRETERLQALADGICEGLFGRLPIGQNFPLLQEYEGGVSVVLDGAFLAVLAQIPELNFERMKLCVDARRVRPFFGWCVQWGAFIEAVFQDRPAPTLAARAEYFSGLTGGGGWFGGCYSSQKS